MKDMTDTGDAPCASTDVPCASTGTPGTSTGTPGAPTDARGAPTDAHRLLWEQQARPRRGPKPTQSLAAITAAGIEIADRAGLAAVTMQNVAQALGVTKMALYRYVPGKTELVALMTDAAIGEPPHLDAVPGGWRRQLDEWTKALFGRFLRHPWGLQASTGYRSIGPNEVGWMEQAIRALGGTGLHGGEMLDVIATLAGHARAMAEQVSAMAEQVSAMAERLSAMADGAPRQTPEQTMTTAFATVLSGHQDRFPALTAALRSAARHGSQDTAFGFGLARILDGVESFIAGRA
jgi:AcrR family transcriptional regulator